MAEHVTSLLQDQVRAPAGAGPVTAAQVGVICMSRAQAICVRNLLRKDGLHDVNVGTVDDFQGQEMRVIFVTAVLTKPVRLPITSPLSRKRGLCVGKRTAAAWRGGRARGRALGAAWAMLRRAGCIGGLVEWQCALWPPGAAKGV